MDRQQQGAGYLKEQLQEAEAYRAVARCGSYSEEVA